MTTRKISPLTAAIVLLTLGLASQSAQAARYSFSQSGYASPGLESDGSYQANQGYIYGDITGSQVIDGLLQVEDMTVHFAGNPFFNFLEKLSNNPDNDFANFDVYFNVNDRDLAFTGEIFLPPLKSYAEQFSKLSQGGLYEIEPLYEGVIQVGNNNESSGEISHLWNALVLAEDFSSIIEPIDSIKYTTSEPVLIAPIPLPGALGLFMAALTGLGVFRRKTHA